MNLNQVICYKPGNAQRWLIVIAAWLLLLAIGYVHHTLGQEYGLYPFYLIPILIVTWFAGFRLGTATALLSIVNWFSMYIDTGPDWTGNGILILNEVIRFGMYMLLVAVAWQWRGALDRESALARVDSLTLLPNRRAFFEQARIELERARRYAHPLNVIMMDLDNFKKVNDQLGHQRGDDLLRTLAKTLHEVTRASDVVGRLGGDEFALIIPDTNVVAFCEKLQREVDAAMRRGHWPVTVSLGVASFYDLPPDVDHLLKCADDLMYEVKGEGKNQIKHAVIGQPLS